MAADFPRDFITGKIAELVFDQMFRTTGKYTVIPFGYESSMPALQQAAKRANEQEILETIKNAPDFALISHDPEAILLVEVKYRLRMDLENYQATALKIVERWKLAWIFYATPNGFTFDKCTDLAKVGAAPTKLSEEVISGDLQEKYLGILNEFIAR